MTGFLDDESVRWMYVCLNWTVIPSRSPRSSEGIAGRARIGMMIHVAHRDRIHDRETSA